MSALVIVFLSTSSCSIGYLIRNSYEQIKILNNREPIKEVLQTNSISETTKSKLQLVLSAREFAISELGLKKNQNYTSYVDLKRDYVTWVVRASPKYKLESYTWWFPIVGSVPYKGYFDRESAEQEAKTFDPEKFDTYVRGASAYSTLGWFNDPVLSSMTRYPDHSLVELIIHEQTHATIYIKSNSDFNERLATFIGLEGARQYYKKVEGEDSKTVQLINDELKDQSIFSRFISGEIEALKKWYQENQGLDEKQRVSRLQQIQERFRSEIKSKMLTENYDWFENVTLNNARLMSLSTYVQDLQVFQDAFSRLGGDLRAFVLKCKDLEKSENPNEALKHL